MKKKLFYITLVVILLVVVVILWLKLNKRETTQEINNFHDCASYSEVDCPSQCVVCPPCLECSSISCQTEEFCAKMGIDRSWYEEIKKKLAGEITSFEKCAAAGYPVLESYPRQCRTPEGKIFTEIILPIEPEPIGPDTEPKTKNNN